MIYCMISVEELIRKLMDKGVDVTELLLDALSMRDPEESMRERMALPRNT